MKYLYIKVSRNIKYCVTSSNPDDTIDSGPDQGLYVDHTYERIRCLECVEDYTPTSCTCRYYLNIKPGSYKRAICDYCLKYCDCEKCGFQLWKLTKCISDAKPGTEEADDFNDAYEDSHVHIGISILDGRTNISTSWNP
jgi:hypothetical protein